MQPSSIQVVFPIYYTTILTQMKAIFTLSFLFASSLILTANNGKIAYANSLSNFSLDGDLKEWENVKSNPIDLYFDQALNQKEDCAASFRSAFKNNQLYFTIEVTDDNLVSNPKKDWDEQDAVVLYLNLCHSEDQSGVVQIIFNQQKRLIQSHGKQKDICHGFFGSDNVKHAFIQRENKSIYEISIDAGSPISHLTTIGLDFYILDHDENDPSTTDIVWGPSNFSKYYMPGYLGDLVCFKNLQIGEAIGYVQWDKSEAIDQPLPNQVDIKSFGNPNFKVSATLDTLGKFKTSLPTGKYYAYSAQKNTNPFDQMGSGNQRRINNIDKVYFEIKPNEFVVADTLKLRTFSPPEYLFHKAGILPVFTEQDQNELDNFVESYKAYYDIPAVSLAIIKDDKIVYSNNYGSAQSINDVAFADNNVFQIASITKSVFAFITMRLVEKKIIDLDAPLYTYLPFKQIEHNDGYKNITARIILSHQSGLPNWAWGGTGGWKHGEKADLAFKPGSQYSYSGEGYEYLGRVIEHVTSKSLEQLLEEEFKRPLGIDNLYFRINDEIQQVTGKFGHQTTLWNNNETVGVAHSVLSDAKSFAKFVCELGKQKKLKPATYNEIFTPLQPVTGFEHPDTLYWDNGIGLGFFTQESEHGKAVLHGGNNADFQSEFLYYLKPKLGFVVFTNCNRGHKLIEALGRFLLHGKS